MDAPLTFDFGVSDIPTDTPVFIGTGASTVQPKNFPVNLAIIGVMALVGGIGLGLMLLPKE